MKTLRQMFGVILLIGIFLKEFLLACIAMLKLIYFKPKKMNSGFFEIDLKSFTPGQQVVIAHFITLTPGTLSVDLNDGQLTVHCLNLKDQESTLQLVRENLPGPLSSIWRQT